MGGPSARDATKVAHSRSSFESSYVLVQRAYALSEMSDQWQTYQQMRSRRINLRSLHTHTTSLEDGRLGYVVRRSGAHAKGTGAKRIYDSRVRRAHTDHASNSF